MSYKLIDNESENQYEFHIENSVARIEYIKIDAKKTIYLTHTEVPKSMEGKGVSSQLVLAVFKVVEEAGWKIIPLCPFVAMYIKKHPEWSKLLAKGFNVE